MGSAAPDCLVVGSGSFGVWTALRLRETGRTVALIDAHGPGNPLSSSGGASRIIRMGYGADEIYTRWAMRSLTAWKELFARAGQPELFQHTGVLWSARPGHPHAEGTRAAFKKVGVPHEILDAAAVERLCPELRAPDGAFAILEPDSGALLASQAVQTVAAEAARLGVETLTQRAAWPIKGVSAGEYIFACGPWLPKLFPEVIGARIRVTRQPVLYFDAPQVRMPVWIDFSDPRGGYALPPINGKGFKLALDEHGEEFDPDSGSRQMTGEEESRTREFLSERFPALAKARLVDSEVCQYESTCTGDFLIDRHPALPHVWLVGGGSGHGFKHGPAVGDYVTQLLNGGPNDSRFDWRSKSTVPQRSVY